MNPPKTPKSFRQMFSDDGLFRDAREWSEDDWRTLHEAMQKAIKEISERHQRRRSDGQRDDGQSGN